MRLDWLEPTLSEGGTTVGRACAVTIELVELCGDYNVTILSFSSSVQIDKIEPPELYVVTLLGIYVHVLRYVTGSSSVNKNNLRVAMSSS